MEHDPVLERFLEFADAETIQRYCNTSNTNKRRCREQYNVLRNKINRECPKYKEAGIELKPEDLFDTYIKCNLERIRDKLIIRGDLLNFIRSDPERNIIYLQTAVRHGKLLIAKWLQSKFNFTTNEVVQSHTHFFAEINRHFDILRWLHNTFNIGPINLDYDGGLYD